MKEIEIIQKLKDLGVYPKMDSGELKLVGDVKDLTQEVIHEVRAHKDLLIHFLAESAENMITQEPIPRVEESTHYSLTNAQKRIWILSQFEGGNEAYNICELFYVKGNVNWSFMERSIQYCIQRHESLRSSIGLVEEEPVLFIHDTVDFELVFDDLDTSSGTESAVEREEQAFRNTSFDLEKTPLFNMKVLRMKGDEHLFMVNMHHVISDGWSAGVLINEILENYSGMVKAQKNALPELSVQYKDYRQWLENKVNGTFGERALEFWKKKELSSFPLINLPTDYPRDKDTSFDGNSLKILFDKERNDKLESYIRNSGNTLFNFYRAVLSIAMHKWTNQDELILGTAVSGRTHPDIQKLIGLFVNTVPLCSTFDRQLTFSAYLKKMAEDSLEVFSFQDFPLDRILEKESLKREVGRNPLFDVLMVVRDNPIFGELSSELRELNFELDYYDDLNTANTSFKSGRSAKFDLSFLFSKNTNSLNYFEIEYKNQLFERSTVEKLQSLFLRVMDQVLRNDNICLEEIEIVSSSEKEHLLNELNQPIHSHDEKSIMNLIDPVLSKESNRTALVIGDRTVSYKELNAEINCVANALKKRELNKVGVMMSRSEKVVISILGALRANVTYVPIDVNYPDHRIEYLISDAKVECLIVDESGKTRVPDGYIGGVVPYNDLERVTSFSPLQSENPQQIAYLIYTSGSTGKPKGVEITHGNVIAFLKWATKEFQATPFEVLYAGTSHCFDLSVFEMLLPLLLEKKIRVLKDATETVDYINKDVAVFLNTVPSVVRNLLDIDMDWRNVVALNMAGEPIPKIIKDQLDFKRIEVRNLYGPSEDTTYSTFYRFEDDQLGYIPIGRPVGDTQAYILDDQQRLLPKGVVGEIYLSGQSVANGYYNKPELTNERFTANPFVEGQRMYKTGDLGRWRENGLIEFIGRSDDQVKVRGYRIELGEIQYQLEKLNGIKSAVVIVHEFSDDKEIVAYYQPDEATALEIDAIKEILQSNLPSYMIPGIFMELEQIPLNANGKVEKQRLPEPHHHMEMAITPPTNRKEEKMLEIWEEILGTDGFGIAVNFFDIGGDSLKVTQLRNRVSVTFLKEVTMNEIFENPTVEKLVELLDKKEKKVDPKISALISERKNTFPLSFAQERLWILNSFEDVSKAYHMPAAFEVKGNLDITLLEQALEHVVEKHEILRTVFSAVDGNPMQIVLSADDFSVQISEILINESKDLKEAIMKDWQEPFNLEAGPLWRTSLWQQGDLQVLSFNMHHIISDGWSINLLFQEVLQAYAQLLTGQEVQIGQLELQYKDFALWQRKEITEDVLAKQLAFWKDEVFVDGIHALNLPYDRERPTLKTYNGAIVSHTFSEELSTAIKKQAVDHGVSLFMGIMANINLLLKKLSNEDSITVGIPVVGRESSQLRELIGFFVNTLPICTPLNGEDTFSELLTQQRNQLIRAFEHQNFPFEKLVDEIQPKRDMSRSPLFDVMVTLQSFEVIQKAGIELDNHAKLSGLEFGTSSTKYDITFSFSEDEDTIQTELEYNTDLFDESTIKKMVDQMIRLFEITTNNCHLKLDEISILDSEEEAIIQELSKVEDSVKSEDSVLSLFERVVSTDPNRLAVKAQDKQLTFAELDQRSAQIATWLLTHHGIQKNAVVGLLPANLEDLALGILAIIKSGTSFILLDSEVPQSRTQTIASAAYCHHVLSSESVDEWLMESGIGQISIKDCPIDQKVERELISESDTASYAYLVNRAGAHVFNAVKNNQLVMASATDLFRSDDQMSWVSSGRISIERSMWMALAALLNGDTLVESNVDFVKNPQNALAEIEEHQDVTLVLSETEWMGLSNFIDSQESVSVGSVVRILLNHKTHSAVTEKVRAVLGKREVIQVLGIDGVFGPVLVDRLEETPSLKPVSGIGALVLDRGGKPCGLEVIGELCVKGLTVLGHQSNEPLRTGKQAKITKLGNLQIVGQLDRKVDVDGVRFSLGEIEREAERVDGVQTAIAHFDDRESMSTELILLVEGVYGSEAESRIIENLKITLPKYMWPTKVVCYEKFPVDENGEINKEELLESNLKQARISASAGPRNEQDQKIIEIWEGVLGKKGIGIYDNFFELGGHSLKATRVISKIQEAFDVKIELKDLFMDPTVESIGDYVSTITWVNEVSETNDSEGEELIF